MSTKEKRVWRIWTKRWIRQFKKLAMINLCGNFRTDIHGQKFTKLRFIGYRGKCVCCRMQWSNERVWKGSGTGEKRFLWFQRHKLSDIYMWMWEHCLQNISTRRTQQRERKKCRKLENSMSQLARNTIHTPSISLTEFFLVSSSDCQTSDDATQLTVMETSYFSSHVLILLRKRKIVCVAFSLPSNRT